MSRKNDVLHMTQAESVIGPGVKVEGELQSEGDIAIDGWLHGHVKTSGDVTVGYNAEVKAAVEARNVFISGKVTGDITAKEQVTITETGKLTGNIQCGSLAVGAGALFSGQVKMTANETKSTEEPA